MRLTMTAWTAVGYLLSSNYVLLNPSDHLCAEGFIDVWVIYCFSHVKFAVETWRLSWSVIWNCSSFFFPKVTGRQQVTHLGFNNVFCASDPLWSQPGFSSVWSAECCVGGGWCLCYSWHLMGSLLVQLKEDLKKQKEAACFKARPNVVVYQEPFVPKKENKMLSGRVLAT